MNAGTGLLTLEHSSTRQRKREDLGQKGGGIGRSRQPAVNGKFSEASPGVHCRSNVEKPGNLLWLGSWQWRRASDRATAALPRRCVCRVILFRRAIGLLTRARLPAQPLRSYAPPFAGKR
jgi:hypothetical protein